MAGVRPDKRRMRPALIAMSWSGRVSARMQRDPDTARDDRIRQRWRPRCDGEPKFVQPTIGHEGMCVLSINLTFNTKIARGSSTRLW